jgi:P-type E1-E2 ATPase
MTMQSSFPPQATQAPHGEEKGNTQTVPLKKLFEQLGSSEQGLTEAEASKRLDTYGPNDTTDLKRKSPVVQFLRLFLNPLVAILLVACIVSAILGDPVDASIIVVIILLSNILNFVQTYHSQNTVEKLRANVAPTASVLRGSIDILCSDKTGTLTSGETKLEGSLDLQGKESERVLLFGYLNSTYQSGIKSPLDEAILQHGTVDVGGYSKVCEIPFDFERRCLSVVVRHESESLLIIKGAPESILQKCSAYESNGERKPMESASDEERTTYANRYRDLSTQGYRVLAVAYRSLAQQEVYRKTDEQNMVLLGFLTFADPPKADVAQVL